MIVRLFDCLIVCCGGFLEGVSARGGIKGAIFRDEWILHIDCILIASPCLYYAIYKKKAKKVKIVFFQLFLKIY